MSDRTPTTHSSGGGAKQGFAAGTSIAAAIVLMTVGVLEIFQAISALADDNFFVVGPEYV